MKTLTRVYKEKIKVSNSGECCYGGVYTTQNNDRCLMMQNKFKDAKSYDDGKKRVCKRYNKELARFRVGYKRCDECIKDFGY